MNYKAVIFDLDGTLTDSAIGIVTSVRYALERMQWPVPDDGVLRSFLGPPLAVSFQRHCGMTQDQAIQATRIYRERYQAIGWQENRVYPGIRRLLQALKRQGLYLGVATGKPQRESEKILERFNLLHYFDAVAGPQPTDYFANKRDLIVRAMAGHEGPAIMVGDRDSDILAAQALHMDSLAVLYGYGPEAEMTSCGATSYADSPDALWDALGVARSASGRGFFISLEGNDGSGKSTQARYLTERLQASDYDLLATREPGGTQVSEKIRAILLDRENSGLRDMTEALLYAAARAQHVRELIVPALQQGKVVLSDRYVDSSIAYQGAGRQLGVDLVRQINAPAIDGCLPDLTVLLDMDAETAMQRRQTASTMDRIEMLGDDFHQRVEDAYQLLKQHAPERFAGVDAAGKPEEVAEAIADIVLDRLRQWEDS